jgi:heterodisulfide reductase subunit A
VYLIEKEKQLGGMARRLHSTLEGMDVQDFLNDLTQKVFQHPLVHVYMEASIVNAEGYVGNFHTTVRSKRGLTEIKHGVAIIAIGADEHRPSEYLYGEDERVMTQLELEARIAESDAAVTEAQNMVMIQCVGCRNEDRNYCSRICCSHAIKNALTLKKKNPDMNIYVLFRDMRTYRFAEDYYRQASSMDVKFIRYEPEDAPIVEAAEAEGTPVVRVTATDYVLGQKLELDADFLVLSTATIPASTSNDVSRHFKVTLGPDGFFTEAHVKLRPVDFAAEGIFLCGMAHYPKHISETISQAYGAAGRAAGILAQDALVASGSVCQVEESLCVSCGACISVCSYGAIDFHENDKGYRPARVNPVLCKGDGLCNAKCPTGAIQLKHYTNDEIVHQLDAEIPDPRMLATA